MPAVTALSIDNAVCLSCRYPLRGLPSTRCPECGRVFDPGNPHTFRIGSWRSKTGELARHVRRWALIGAGRMLQVFWFALPAGLVWAAFAVNVLYCPLALLVIGALVIRSRRWAALALAVVVSPPTFIVGRCAGSYRVWGANYVYTRPYLNHSCGNIDPQTRCSRPDSGGCGTRSFASFDVLSRALERPMEKVMYALSGPPAHAYTGPYPSEMAAIAAARAGATVKIDSFLNDFIIGAQRVRIRELRQLGAYWNLLDLPADPDVEPIVGTVIGGRCAVVRVPVGPRSDKHPARVVLLDVWQGDQFAVYFDPDPLPTTAGSDASLRPVRTSVPPAPAPRVDQPPPPSPNPAADWDALFKTGEATGAQH
jgi:hypothetical protein